MNFNEIATRAHQEATDATDDLQYATLVVGANAAISENELS